MSTSPHQLSLLADHLKLSLLERQRAVTLNLEATTHDSQIIRSLATFHDGLEELEARARDLDEAADDSSDLARLRKQYDDLHAQFHGTGPASANVRQPNDPALKSDFRAAQSTPRTVGRKNVRFRDNPDEQDAQDQANRAALFSSTQSQEPYRDDPSTPDQSHLDNQQIHAYHKQVLRDQDEQLETLGRSVGRQRMLGIQIGDELDEHVELLEDIESGVDRHQSTLNRAQSRLGVIARKSRQNWSWITIAILIIILLLLIIVLK